MKLSEEEKETSVSYWSDVETSVSDVSSITRARRECTYVCICLCINIRTYVFVHQS